MESNTQGSTAPFVPPTLKSGQQTEGRLGRLLHLPGIQTPVHWNTIPHDDLIKIIDTVLAIVDDDMFKDKIASRSTHEQ